MAPKWHKVGGGSFFKFDVPGKALEGIWRGSEPSAKYAHDNGVIQTEDGERRLFTINTSLVKTLGRIRKGALIRIEYTGKTTGKSGTEYKTFEVCVGDPDNDILDTAVPVKPGEEEEVPF